MSWNIIRIIFLSLDIHWYSFVAFFLHASMTEQDPILLLSGTAEHKWEFLEKRSITTPSESRFKIFSQYMVVSYCTSVENITVFCLFTTIPPHISFTEQSNSKSQKSGSRKLLSNLLDKQNIIMSQRFAFPLHWNPHKIVDIWKYRLVLERLYRNIEDGVLGSLSNGVNYISELCHNTFSILKRRYRIGIYSNNNYCNQVELNKKWLSNNLSVTLSSVKRTFGDVAIARNHIEKGIKLYDSPRILCIWNSFADVSFDLFSIH